MTSRTLQPSKEVIDEETEKFHAHEDPAAKEELYVHTIYNEIAPHFSQTRYKPWPIVEKFLLERATSSIGIDVGCGNGKYLKVNPNVYVIGSDRSSGLIECASSINAGPLNDLVISDGMFLPHADAFCDFAISIAVIHHFSTELRRIQAIQEILRCLKPGGEALIYCWALEQENSRRGYKEGMDQDILVPWVLQNKQKKKKKQATDTVPAEETTPEPTEEPKTKMRYYHMYKKGELVDNCTKAGGEVVDHGYEKDNWWCIVKKV